MLTRRNRGLPACLAVPLALFAVLILQALILQAPARGEPGGPLDPHGPPTLARTSLPLLPLLASTQGQEYVQPYYWRPQMNFDMTAGPYFPIDGEEDFDVGGTMDLKFQAQVVGNLFLGFEFAFAGHDKDDSGHLYFDGSVGRYFFLFPIEYDIPLTKHPQNPLSLRLGLAPGIQIADPQVDHDLEDDLLFFQGLDVEEEDFVAFNLRARIGLRLPLGPHFGCLLEAAYDLSEGKGEVKVDDLNTGTRQTFDEHVNLSGVSLLFGLQILF